MITRKEWLEQERKNRILDRHWTWSNFILGFLPPHEEDNPGWAFIRGYAEGLQGSIMGYWAPPETRLSRWFWRGKRWALTLHYPFPEDFS